MDLGLVSMYVGAFCACKMGFTLIFVLVSFCFCFTLKLLSLDDSVGPIYIIH